MSEASTRARQRGPGATPRGPPPPPAEALARARLAAGASLKEELSWGLNRGGRRKAEAPGAALGPWGRSVIVPMG